MLKDTSSSCEGKDHKSDAPIKDVARPHGKVQDFATRQQTYRYTKDDFFTLRSGERVPRLRGGGEFDDYGDTYNTGWNDDTYNTGWNDDTYNTGWNDDSYNTRWNDDTYNTGWHRDPSDSEGYARRSPGRDWYDQPEEWRENAGRGRSLSPERDPIGREIHPGEWSGGQDGTNVDKDEQERRDEAEALLKEAAEFIQRLKMKEQEEAGQHNGDGNGGGDGGNHVVYEGDDSSSDGAPTDLSAVRADYPALDKKLLLIEEKLNVEGHADTFQIIEHVSQEERIIGFDRWVYRFAEHDADHMFGHVMELAEAQRKLQKYIDDPNVDDSSVEVYIGQDLGNSAKSFDIVLQRDEPGEKPEILHQIEVLAPRGAILKELGQALINAINHAADKLPDGVRAEPDKHLPPGELEATIAIDPWPPEIGLRGR